MVYSQALNDKFDISIGADLDYREIDVFQFELNDGSVIDYDGNLAGQTVRESSIYSQLGYQNERWKALFGIRRADNELFGINVSSRGTLMYSFSENRSLKFIAGQSYRSPSLFELYIVGRNNVIIGNPNLQPEQSTSYELAYVKAVGNFFVQGSIYYADYENKIFRGRGDALVPNGSGLFIENAIVYSNGVSFVATGLEVETRYSMEGIDVFANINVIDGDDGDMRPGSDNYNFKYVPDYTLTAGASTELHGGTVSLVLRHRASTEGPEASIGSSTEVDVSLSYPQSWNSLSLLHRLRMTNLTDEVNYVPEYARRRGLNEVPNSLGRAFNYELQIVF